MSTLFSCPIDSSARYVSIKNSHPWRGEKDTNDFLYLYSGVNASLPDSTAEAIIRDLSLVMPDYNVEQYFGNQPGIFQKYDHLAVGIDKKANRVAGMCGSRWLKTEEWDFLYIWSAMVGDEYRGSKVFNEILRMHFRGVGTDHKGFPRTISTKTYNPVVYKLLTVLFCKTAGVKMYPDIIVGEHNPGLLARSKAIAEVVGRGLKYIEDKSIIVGGQAAVSPDYFPYMQKTNNSKIEEMFERNLTRADQVLCVIDIPDACVNDLQSRNRWQPFSAS